MVVTFGRHFWTSLLEVTFGSHFCMPLLVVTFWRHFYTILLNIPFDVTFRRHLWTSLLDITFEQRHRKMILKPLLHGCVALIPKSPPNKIFKIKTKHFGMLHRNICIFFFLFYIFSVQVISNAIWILAQQSCLGQLSKFA